MWEIVSRRKKNYYFEKFKFLCNHQRKVYIGVISLGKCKF